jgi:cytochrome c oxidase assembly protein subunit 11
MMPSLVALGTSLSHRVCFSTAYSQPFLLKETQRAMLRPIFRRNSLSLKRAYSMTNVRGKASMSRQQFEHQQQQRNNNVLLYLLATAFGVLGFSYASVPLYKVFCQATGYGGTTQLATEEQLAKMSPVEGARPLTIKFSSSVSSTLPWRFTPQQKSVKVVPGETALAFYTANNDSKKPVIGVATYNVLPMKAGVYFNKVQCFCFDEQRLKGEEEVDMPVFFFIDPAFLEDPEMEDVQSITLSYTFFRSATASPEEI